MDKKRRAKLIDTLAIVFIAIFIGGCLLLAKCPSKTTVNIKEYAGVRDSTTITPDTIPGKTKIKKVKKEKLRKRPKERNFRDESVPSSF